MKLRIFLVLLTVFSLTSCSLTGEEENAADETGTLLYTSLCGSGKIHWVDNEIILYDDGCEGTLKKINVTTKAVQLIRFNQDSLPLSIFHTQQLPNMVFYGVLTSAEDPLQTSINLYARNLTTGKTVLVKEDLPNAHYYTGIVMGKKRMGISSERGLLIIDLEKGTSQEIPVTGTIKAFSPDDSKMVIYPASPTDPTDALIYDFSCQCAEPSPFSGAQALMWRPQGVYGYNATHSWEAGTLQFLNATTGAEVHTYTNFVSGPWFSPNSTLSAIWLSSTSTQTERKGKLLSFDVASQSTKELYTANCCNAAFNSDVTDAAFSPDEKKIAIVKDGQVRMLFL